MTDVETMTDATDRRDLLKLAETYLRLRRCAGGRLVMDGLVCSHCDSDYPERICRSPKKSHAADARQSRLQYEAETKKGRQR